MENKFKLKQFLVENPSYETLPFLKYGNDITLNTKIHSDFNTYVLIEINNITLKQYDIIEHAFDYQDKNTFKKVDVYLKKNILEGVYSLFFKESEWYFDLYEKSNRNIFLNNKTAYILSFNRRVNGLTINEYNDLSQKDIVIKYADQIKTFLFNYLIECKRKRASDLFVHKEFIDKFFQYCLDNFNNDENFKKVFNVNTSKDLNITNISIPEVNYYMDFLKKNINNYAEMSDINYQQNKIKLSEYVLDNVKDLTKLINENSEILFDPANGLDDPIKDFADYLNYKRNFKLFDNQKNIINAFTRYFKTEKAGFLISQPGSGKTSMSISISNLWKPNKNKNIFVLCPPHLNKKWAMDISVLAQNSMVYECDSVSDYINKIEPEISKRNTTNYILINPKLIKHSYFTDINLNKDHFNHIKKLSEKDLLEKSLFYSPEATKYSSSSYLNYLEHINSIFIGNAKTVTDKDRILLGKMAKIIKSPFGSKEAEKAIKTYADSKYLHFRSHFAPNIPNFVEKYSSEKSLDNNFVSLDWYIQRKSRHNVDFFIIDEMHLFLSDSMQAQGAQRISSCAKRTLGLTGTVFNGMVTNLFYMFLNFFPAKLKEVEKLNAKHLQSVKTNFKNKYGNKEKIGEVYNYEIENLKKDTTILDPIISVRPKEAHYYYYTRQSPTGDGTIRDGNSFLSYTVKDIPGINPEIFTQLMSSCCIFMTMSDMSKELPEITESVISCELDFSIKKSYENLLDSIKKSDFPNIVKAQKVNKIAGWLDHPCIISDDHFNFKGSDGKNNKLTELLNIVKHHDNECILVYTYYDKHSPINNEILQALIKEGIKANILTDSVAPAKRIDWFEKQKENGVRVVIVNPKLIETGLDLLDFTTIVFYQLNSNFFTMRQASRRSYRLNQKNNVNLYYLYYKGTVQENIISVMAERLKAVKILEGDFEDEGLEAMTNTDRADSSNEIFNKMITNEEYVNDDSVLGLNKYAQKIEKIIDNSTFKVHKINFVKKPMTKKKINYRNIFVDLNDKISMYTVMNPKDKIKEEISYF